MRIVPIALVPVIVVLLIVATSGCVSGSDPAAKAIIEKCAKKSASYDSVRFEGRAKATMSNGQQADRSLSGSMLRTVTNKHKSKEVITGHILSGKQENVILYYSEGHIYFNTGNGWWKRSSGLLMSLATFSKYFENIRILSSNKTYFKISCDMNRQYLEYINGVNSRTTSADKDKLKPYIDGTRISVILSIRKKDFLLTDILEHTNLRFPAGDSLELTESYHYFGYGSPVDVTAPPGALNAKEAENGRMLPLISGYTH